MADEKKPFRPMRTMSICIDDVPAEAYVKAGKTGKTWINFTNEEKEPDQWGNDQVYYIQQTAEERTNHSPKVFVGRGKTLGQKTAYNKAPQATTSNHASDPQPNAIPTNTNFDEDKDLPF